MKNFQSLFEFLYKVSLRGMNFGLSEVTNSGELNVLHNLARKSKINPFVVFDVGANQGQYANAVYNIFGNRAKIFSFEPAKATFQILSNNTKYIKNISLKNFALGETIGRANLYYEKEGSGLASINKRRLEHFNIKFDKSDDIEVRTLDQFCAENKISSIDLLKLDVEGYELEALKGAKLMLGNGAIKNIQFEFGGANIDSRTYFQDFYYLLKDKYKISRVLRNGLREIDRYAEWQEIFITSNYLAELK